MNDSLHNAAAGAIDPASFRDPAGFVFRHDGTVYRQVNEVFRDQYDRFMACGLYQRLADEGLLLAHEEVAGPAGAPGAHRILRPEQLGFLSYPYEWCFSQMQRAALLTLDIQALALAHGMVLKDASAYNVQFHRGRAVFIDTLSFEPYVEGVPWVAYRQFCQHFLAPLALMSRTDIRLGRLLREFIDGIPLDLASSLLPAGTWLRPGLMAHLHLHARTQRAFSDSHRARDGAGQRLGRVSRAGLEGIVAGLRSTVAGLQWRPAGTEWADYYSDTNYSDASFGDKRRLVAEYLAAVSPRSVWDLGANTGLFSRIASAAGIETVAFDTDPAAVEINYRKAVADGERNLLPLVMDLVNPSPALGWAGCERSGLVERGPAGCVMALALIHHLAISNNVPLSLLAAFFAAVGEALIIEFVPKSDSQVQRLLRSRADIFDGYHRQGFEEAFSAHFAIARSEPVHGSERTLYLMHRRASR